MPEHLPDIPPFHRMLRRLNANGFLLGVDTYLRVAEYWQAAETDEALTTEALKAQLSALLCRSAEQQEVFGQVFDTFLPKGIKPLVNDGESKPEQEQRTDPKPPTPIKTDEKKSPERSIPERPFIPPNPSEKIAPVLPLLNFPEEPLRVWNLTEMGPAMTPLQEKVWTDSTEWDVPGTIRAITRAGGYPKLVFKKRKQAPRYLALIEQQSPRDHLAGYAAELVREINRRDLEAEFYFFDKNPGHCWKEQREQQTHISIERLRSEWSGARLLLLSHASHFVNPATGTPSNLALELPDDFSNVALLATNANVEWGAAERSLSSLMPVVPMSVEGLGKLMAAWNGAAQPSFEEWQAILPEQSPPKLTDGYRQPDPSEVFMEVYRYLGNEAFMWLCACAVFPELYFELTCILHDEAIPLSADLSQWQRNERWNQALRLLSRLEWFRKGELPETLAEELKKNLTPTDLLLLEGEIKRILAISKNQVSDQSYAAELRNELFDWLASQSFRVLWIDDRPQNNQQYRDSWSKSLGIYFKLATTSSEAHGYLNNERFDLVISDLGRPGEELTGQITLDIVAKRAPVVFFTNKRGLNLRGSLLSAGAKEVTNSVGVLSELVREELRKKFPLMEQVQEVPDLDLSGLENVAEHIKKPKKEKAATQKKATKKAQPPASEQLRKDQEMLQKLGFFEGEVDGVAGEKTRLAVAAFQKSAGLVADGILGPQTRGALEMKTAEMDAYTKAKSARRGDPIREMVSSGELETALKAFIYYWPNNIEVNSLSSRYNILQKDNLAGIIALEDYQRQLNQITSSLLELLEKLEQENSYEKKGDKVGEKLIAIQTELLYLTNRDIGLALKRFKQYSNRDSFNNNSFTLIESRYNDNKIQLLQGVVSDEDAALEFSKIRRQLKKMIGELEGKDLLDSIKVGKEELENTTGYLSYRMPKEMQVGVEYDCIVRLGYKREMLLENIEEQGDEIIKPLKMSDMMGVKLIEPNSDEGYSIEAIHDSVQFIERDLVTEWLFQVTPLKLDASPLVLKISIIEIIEGLEQKRDEMTNLEVKILPHDRPSQSYK